MPRSTAKFIPYDLRPAKQAERRILLDFLESAKEGGLNVSDSRYVGMGGFKFYDFIMMHRHVGLKDMISLEHDPKMAIRANFNRPYDFIKVEGCDSTSYIDEKAALKKSIFWLDYDDALNDTTLDDIALLGDKMTIGSMAFVTVAADIPRDLIPMTEEERLASLIDQFGDFALAVREEDVEEGNFPAAVFKILSAAFRSAFASRVPLIFNTAFKVIYRDSTNMLTVGGFLADDLTSIRVSKRLKANLPFLYRVEQAPYRIKTFNLSDRERSLIEFASTRRRKSKEENQLRKLGITKGDIDAYRDILRFVPRYHEALF